LLPASWLRNWPPHVWFGFSAENQRRLEEGWRHAVKIPASILWVSLEPLLGPLDLLTRIPAPLVVRQKARELARRIGASFDEDSFHAGLSWVVVAGESGGPKERSLVWGQKDPKTHILGHEPRPDRIDWVRQVRDQCQTAGVPFFFKGWGGPKPTSGGRLLDGRTWNEFPRDR
jgi:protein gp37